MKDIIRKLSSRKLWLSLAGVTSGLAMVFGVDGNDITTVAGAIMSLCSVIIYIVTEGKIDAERIKNTIQETQIAVDLIEGTEKNG